MADIVTLDQVRTHLQWPDNYTSADDELTDIYIPAATDAITGIVGEVIPTTYDEYYDGGDYAIYLRHTPVLSVQLVEEGWGFTNYALQEVQSDSATIPTMFAFSIDMPNSGKISRRAGGNINIPFVRVGSDNIHVIYQTGLAVIPGSITLAALQLIAFWWRAFEQDQAAADPYEVIPDEYASSRSGASGPMSTRNFGLPSWLPGMLTNQRRDPIIG